MEGQLKLKRIVLFGMEVIELNYGLNVKQACADFFAQLKANGIYSLTQPTS
jgi:hypothetical protein